MIRVRVAQQEMGRLVGERTRRLARAGDQMSPAQAAHVLGMDPAEAACAGLLAHAPHAAPTRALARYWNARGWWTSVLALAHHHTRTHGRKPSRPRPVGPNGLVLHLHVDLDGHGWTTMVLAAQAEDPPRPVQERMLRPHLLSAPLSALTCYDRTVLAVPSDTGGVRELHHPRLAAAAHEEILSLHALATNSATVHP